MKVICIDSSGLVASVAVVEDDNLIAEYNVQYKKTHSQTLLPMLDEIKRMIDLDMTTVDAIAISRGPGSFTGLRIGSATAKGLCQALDIPIIEVGTLEGMALNLYGCPDLIVPIMDARRSQVYTGIYSFENYELKTYLDECALDIHELTDKVNKLAANTGKNVVFLGDGVPVFSDQIGQLVKSGFSYAPAHLNRQRASAFGYLAIEKLKKGETVPYAEHAPSYLRLSQAERERKEGIRNKGSNYNDSPQ